jgi:hypothetical protein
VPFEAPFSIILYAITNVMIAHSLHSLNPRQHHYKIHVFLSVPPNGLVIYCGTIVTDEGKEKKVNIDFEPFRPINTSLYLCDNKFHTEVSMKCRELI